MLKYIGIFILASSLSVYGTVLSESLKESNLLRKEVIQLLNSIERSIRYKGASYVVIIRECSLPFLRKSGFCEGILNYENAERTINTTLSVLSEEDRRMLCEFFSNLGKSPYSEQVLKLCSYYIDYFEKTQADVDKNLNTRVLLYKKIGLIAGILTAIIFI